MMEWLEKSVSSDLRQSSTSLSEREDVQGEGGNGETIKGGVWMR